MENKLAFSHAYANLLPPYQLGKQPLPQVLGRYLPQIPSELFHDWPEGAPPGEGWVIDPFGLSPSMDLELVRNGYSVLVCVNNPVVRLILECSAHPPTDVELNRAFNLLANAVKAGTRLETHITSLYQTRCVKCSSSVQASAYLWDRGAESPFAREYTCPYCWDSGQYPFTAEDEEVLAQVKRIPMQRAWAVERIASRGDPLRIDAEEIVDSHGSRALYIIFNLINRLESLSLTERDRLIIQTLLLEVLDDATPLHHLDSSVVRPRLLTVPSRYKEQNLWQSFQRAVDRWKIGQPKIECTPFPLLPTQPGISYFSGRIKDLGKLPGIPLIKQVIAIFPRPNQAFWSLSAVWSAWLLGREQAASMTQVIARHRYDWAWHTTALAGSLRAIIPLLAADASFLGLIPEVEPAFLTTVFHAMHQAGFENRGLSLKPEDELAQTFWSVERKGNDAAPASLASEVRLAAQMFLEEKGEPATYLEMTAAACLAVVQKNAWPDGTTQSNLLQLMRAAFSNPILFSHYGSGEQTLESGLWCLRKLPAGQINTSDRIEELVLNLLAKGGSVRVDEVETKVRQSIRPIWMPVREYIQHLLISYAEETPPSSGEWQIKVQEHPALRDSDGKTIRSLLVNLSSRLDYQADLGKNTVRWLDPQSGQPRYEFFIQSHARLNAIASEPDQSGTIRSFVLPGSRSNLIAYKLKNNPVLAEYMKDQWHILKFRHITRLAENPMITTESLQLWLDNDPPEYQPVQMDLF